MRGSGLVTAEHVAVGEEIVEHEQVACESGVVEVVGEAAHLAFDVVTFGNYLFSVFFLGSVLTAVLILEVVKRVEFIHECVDGFSGVFVAKLAVSLDVVKRFFTEARFAVELARERVVILEHQLAAVSVLVGVDSVAEVDELIVVVKGREVNP